ncbi:plasmid pRiA4b ORF-3 family protein [Psychroflexus sp. CAK57W]|uniref:plasmid pRiA4b ORF-3 family protein n=1 Tax=Psychroflexus curvus TaxID=2873595 RepID=UPI001CCFAA40|nr:plasmid pRiA4b ORF-3 family protein [Psychroflexus curvus]MBZ9628404.1 plasmid pRiA4b ORF-3 family protein [Psychroflexus curvus]MBZ9788149.1 plasmid pRiA4b ORF-3 family protein [Psychroflexus curvus]
MIYKYRVVLDTLDDVIRDIEIRDDATLEDLHNSIAQAFGFDGTEMASFYKSDEEWNQGEEYLLFNMGDEDDRVNMMNETSLDTVFSRDKTKMIYVYDFFNLWTFYVELADIAEPEDGLDYPNLMFAQGQLPESPPDKKFEAEKLDDLDDDEGNGDDDITFENLDDFDFDENWN